MGTQERRAFTEEHLKYKRALAVALYDCVMKMFLRDNCIHGDMHAVCLVIWVTNPAETEQYLHLFLTETGNTQCLAAAARKPSGPQVR